MASDVPERVIAPLLEESLDDLYEHAPCGYLSALPDGLIVKVNQTFLEWTGYSRGDLVGARRFQDLLTPGGRIYHETHYAPLLNMQGTVREIALQIVRADGSRMPVLVNSALRTAEAGTVVRTTVFDASDRRSYERELLNARRLETEARQRTERLQQLTEALVGASDDELVAAAALEAIVEALDARGGVITAGSGADGRVLAERGDTSGAPDEELEVPGATGPLGRLGLHFAATPELSEADRAFLLAAARQCGQALERAVLFAETKRAGRRAAFLAEMGAALERTPELDERARRLVDLVVPELAAGARIDLVGEHGQPVTVAEAGASGPGLELELRARRALGTLVLIDSRVLEAGERDFLLDVAGRAALALENAALYEHERQVARALQESMLTREFPRDPRFHVATHYQPSLETMEVGGDWYDAFLLGDGRLAVVVGDVVGRGIEAASAMGQLRSAVRALAGAGFGPAGVLERLDDFVEQVEVARSATIVFADVDLASGVLRYACAGHPPPIAMAPGEAPELLWDGRSPPLGAFPDLASRAQAEVELTAGTRLILYTDGLVERRGIPIDDGIDALVGAVAGHRDAPLQALVERIPRALLDPREARDDVCMLAMAFGATDRFERSVEPHVRELAPLRADLRAWLSSHRVADPDSDGVVLACSEAVANSIEHGCRQRPDCSVEVAIQLEDRVLSATVRDDGVWRAPSEGGSRGRGMVLIRHFMDEVLVDSDDGTTVRMRLALDRGAGT